VTDDELDDDRPPLPLRPGEVLRLILPAFIGSTAVAVVGLVLILTHHRTVGIVLVVIAAVGGLAFRAALVYRAQMRRDR
jgi:hypothetical protein